MLSLGNQDELDLQEMSFADPDVEAGRRLFLGEDGANRACSFCHDNAGANPPIRVQRKLRHWRPWV